MSPALCITGGVTSCRLRATLIYQDRFIDFHGERFTAMLESLSSWKQIHSHVTQELLCLFGGPVGDAS